MSTLLPNFDMKSRNVLITGGGGLLGYWHSRALLELNANIILIDIDKTALQQVSARLRKKYPKNMIMTFKGDVSLEDEIEEIALSLDKEKVRVDVLINNAAVNPKMDKKNGRNQARIEDFSMEQWDVELSVGLKGAFVCSKVFGKRMASDQKGGNIVNISSDLSLISPDQRIYQEIENQDSHQFVKPVTYSVVKTGLIGLTRYLATYWVKENVRCNALSPGGVENNQDQEFKKRVSNLIPLGRLANKEEYLGAIQYLCSDASSYMNGHNLVVDGGRSIW